jgi:hypothetical protein
MKTNGGETSSIAWCGSRTTVWLPLTCNEVLSIHKPILPKQKPVQQLQATGLPNNAFRMFWKQQTLSVWVEFQADSFRCSPKFAFSGFMTHTSAKLMENKMAATVNMDTYIKLDWLAVYLTTLYQVAELEEDKMAATVNMGILNSADSQLI